METLSMRFWAMREAVYDRVDIAAACWARLVESSALLRCCSRLCARQDRVGPKGLGDGKEPPPSDAQLQPPHDTPPPANAPPQSSASLEGGGGEEGGVAVKGAGE